VRDDFKIINLIPPRPNPLLKERENLS